MNVSDPQFHSFTESQWVLNLPYFHLKIGFTFFEEPFYFKFTCLISSGESASNPGPESDCESTMSRDESPRLHSSRTGFGIPAATQVNVFSVLTVTLVRQYKFTNMNCKNVLCSKYTIKFFKCISKDDKTLSKLVKKTCVFLL